MAFLFKQKQKSPQELVKSVKEGILKLDNDKVNGEARKKVNDDVTKSLTSMKLLLLGESSDSSSETPAPEVIAMLAQDVYSSDLIQLLLPNLGRCEFESRKDAVTIFNCLLRRQIGSRSPTVEYLAAREEIIFAALKGYDNPEIALNTGMILKEMLRYEPLARVLLYSDKFYDFPQYIEQTTFGIACDAMANFKECLTRHKPMVAEYLDANYDKFFLMYATLVASDNYVTKRQSLKLLGEVLLDRANFNVMTKYIADESNLKTMMNLLRNKSKNIQFEAFHVFKVFVANPKKPVGIETILRRNKEKLVEFLLQFHNDKEDEQFMDEKQFLIAQIQKL